jgi:hypothetical protein
MGQTEQIWSRTEQKANLLHSAPEEGQSAPFCSGGYSARYLLGISRLSLINTPGMNDTDDTGVS